MKDMETRVVDDATAESIQEKAKQDAAMQEIHERAIDDAVGRPTTTAPQRRASTSATYSFELKQDIFESLSTFQRAVAETPNCAGAAPRRNDARRSRLHLAPPAFRRLRPSDFRRRARGLFAATRST